MFFILIAVFFTGMFFVLGMHTYDKINTEIEIDASAKDVWSVLTDFEDYSDWNPFVTRFSAELKQGTTADVTLVLPFSKSVDFQLEIQRIDKGSELVCTSKILEPKVLDGIHCFRIETIGINKVKFTQEGKFNGIMLYILLPFIKSSLQSNFMKMNRALKNRAERVVSIADSSPLQPDAV